MNKPKIKHKSMEYTGVSGRYRYVMYRVYPALSKMTGNREPYTYLLAVYDIVRDQTMLKTNDNVHLVAGPMPGDQLHHIIYQVAEDEQ